MEVVPEYPVKEKTLQALKKCKYHKNNFCYNPVCIYGQFIGY